jgi:hypothetical protein
MQVANKHMKKCYTLLVTREIKATVTDLFTPLGWLHERRVVRSVGQDNEDIGIPIRRCCECKMVQQLGKTPPLRFKHAVVIGPSNSTQGMYLRRTKTCSHT